MRSVYYTLPVVLALGANASYNIFDKRQGSGAFVPGTNFVTACAANEVECNDYCLDLAQGDSCCSEGCKSLLQITLMALILTCSDGCPGGSFCLTKGYCCPNELDPATCALNNGVTLSEGFNTNAVPPTPAATATDTTSVAATVTPTGNPFPHANASASTTGRPSSSVTQFEGGAERIYGVASLVIAAGAGAFWLIF